MRGSGAIAVVGMACRYPGAADLRSRLPDPLRGEITLAWEGASASELEAAAEPARELLAHWAEAIEAEDGDRRRALKRLARTMGIGRAELKRKLDEWEAG